MKYLLTLYGDETRFSDMTPEQQAAGMRQWDAYTQAAIDAGVHVGGEGLQPSATATTVRIPESGDPVVTDGPFAETKEQLGGFYLLDCKDRDEATEWAARVPLPDEEPVEIRPVMDYTGTSYEEIQRPAEARS